MKKTDKLFRFGPEQFTRQLCFQLQITRIGVPYQGEPPSLVLPLVYDVSTNLTQLAEKRDPAPASATAAASLQLKRFAEYGANPSECSLFPAVRDLLANLTLPSEPPVISQVIYNIKNQKNVFF